MYDREGLLDLASVIQLKAEIRAKEGDAKGASVLYEVAEGFRGMANDPDLPALALAVPQGGAYRALADLAVALVTQHITVPEYIEAATIWLGRDIATERARDLCPMKQTATA